MQHVQSKADSDIAFSPALYVSVLEKTLKIHAGDVYPEKEGK